MDKTIYPIVIFFYFFKNIKIAHINFPFKDVNSQSAIVELKMPKLKMQFFLTGDASEETFALLAQDCRTFFKKEEGYTSLVMLPHHGSIENKSIHLFNLFKPDILGISAGKAKSIHPSKEIIDWIENCYKESSFFKNFEPIGEKNTLLAFQNGKARLLDKNKVPFICTNTLGSIKVTQNGFLCSFSSQIKINEKFFQIKYSHSVSVDEGIEEVQDMPNVFKANDKYYYVINDKYYSLEEIKSAK